MKRGGGGTQCRRPTFAKCSLHYDRHPATPQMRRLDARSSRPHRRFPTQAHHRGQALVRPSAMMGTSSNRKVVLRLLLSTATNPSTFSERFALLLCYYLWKNQARAFRYLKNQETPAASATRFCEEWWCHDTRRCRTQDQARRSGMDERLGQGRESRVEAARAWLSRRLLEDLSTRQKLMSRRAIGGPLVAPSS